MKDLHVAIIRSFRQLHYYKFQLIDQRDNLYAQTLSEKAILDHYKSNDTIITKKLQTTVIPQTLSVPIMSSPLMHTNNITPTINVVYNYNNISSNSSSSNSNKQYDNINITLLKNNYIESQNSGKSMVTTNYTETESSGNTSNFYITDNNQFTSNINSSGLLYLVLIIMHH
jgi:hypothetical protein